MYAPCNESKYVDFESEVMDDILSVFRKGEDFNYGVEFVLLTVQPQKGHWLL